MTPIVEPETLVLEPGELVPNNRLPVLVYRGGAPPDAGSMQRLFGEQDWTNGWRDGIFPFHHFHSTSHEVLGIARGRVDVRIGGESGQDITLQAGDVVVLPAGTGHKRLSAPGDLEVVGAYPAGRDWDLIRADAVDPGIYARAVSTIQALPLPRTDPLFGAEGPLTRVWRRP